MVRRRWVRGCFSTVVSRAFTCAEAVGVPKGRYLTVSVCGASYCRTHLRRGSFRLVRDTQQRDANVGVCSIRPFDISVERHRQTPVTASSAQSKDSPTGMRLEVLLGVVATCLDVEKKRGARRVRSSHQVEDSHPGRSTPTGF